MRVGVDLGGHTISAAQLMWSCMDSYAITQTTERTTPEGRGIVETVGAVADAVLAVCGGETPELVGVAVPAMLSVDRRHAMKLPNFPAEWTDVDVVELVERALAERGLHCRAAIENDANCYALGEGAAGSARGLTDYVVFTMGTGIGCGIVCDGRLLIGAHGMAGEGGHLAIGGDEPCGCGGCGHAETLAAADGTERRAREAGLPGDFRSLWGMRGTPEADAVIEPTLDAMARTAASAAVLLDPQAVVLGGGMSAAPGIVEMIAERTQGYLSQPFRGLEIRRSTLGAKAALYGAASL